MGHYRALPPVVGWVINGLYVRCYIGAMSRLTSLLWWAYQYLHILVEVILTRDNGGDLDSARDISFSMASWGHCNVKLQYCESGEYVMDHRLSKDTRWQGPRVSSQVQQQDITTILIWFDYWRSELVYCTIQCAKSASCSAFYMESSMCHESASTVTVAASNGSQNVIDAWLSSGKQACIF